MATKEQVLRLLAKGLTPQAIAKKLKCMDAYVRAVKAREFGNGRAIDNRYHRKRYAADPVYAEERRRRARDWYWARKAEQSQSAN